ncbi:MAG: hypothetical protein AAGD11_10295 [Planctomycetota bacterium]
MARPTSLTRAIYRYSVFFFAAVLIASFVAFWRFYYSMLFERPLHHHIHAAIMTGWVMMLVAEGWLIRVHYRKMHRRIGKLSYVLAPAVIVSMISMRHLQASRFGTDLPDFELFFIALNLLSNAPLFALAYGMAIWYVRQPAIHARFMVCTVFTGIIGPILTRFFRFYVYPFTDKLPMIDGTPMPMHIIDPAIILTLAALSIWDWRAHRQRFVFPLMCLGCIVTRILVTEIYTTLLWREFSAWFVSLPLS